jgi:hypothetical protein
MGLGVLAIMAAATLVAFAEVPENITIDACADTKAAVEFPHKAHFEFADCVTCHHTSDGLTAETMADMTVETCGSCHIAPEDAATPLCSEKSLKKNPYHISCVGCHKEHKAEHADTTAPTKCTACHPKEG